MEFGVGALVQALTYTPTLAKYVGTRAGLPGTSDLALGNVRPPRMPGTGCGES